MFWYFIRRLVLVVPTLIGVAVAVFFLIRVMPGDVVVVKLRADGATISDDLIEAERRGFAGCRHNTASRLDLDGYPTSHHGRL